MKTIDDLNALIPSIIDELKRQNHEIGESYFEQDEDGWVKCENKASNYFSYEEDGWVIEVYYDCCGDWDCDPGDFWTPSSCEIRKAWGEVTEITAYHYDEDSDEESEFSDDDLAKLWSALDEELKDIA